MENVINKMHIRHLYRAAVKAKAHNRMSLKDWVRDNPSVGGFPEDVQLTPDAAKLLGVENSYAKELLLQRKEAHKQHRITSRVLGSATKIQRRKRASGEKKVVKKEE